MSKDDEIKLRLPKDRKEHYRKLADAVGVSLSAWIISRCDESDEERLKRLTPPVVIKTPSQAKEVAKNIKKTSIANTWRNLSEPGSLLKK